MSFPDPSEQLFMDDEAYTRFRSWLGEEPARAREPARPEERGHLELLPRLDSRVVFSDPDTREEPPAPLAPAPSKPAEIKLSSDQEQALEICLENLAMREETRLVGPAGSGKSFLMAELIAASGYNPLYLACPTGKAARRLSAATSRHASTVHSLMYMRPEDNGGKPAFGRKKKPLPSDGLLIVDEASMVGKKLYDDLRAWLNPRLRVLYVGDREQLEPVKDTWGPDLEHPTAALTKVHRQALENPILHLATSIRNNKGDTALAYWGEAGDERLQMGGNWLEWYVERRDLDSTLITFTHAERRHANIQIRSALGHRGVLVPGDRLLARVNDHAQDIVNGDVFNVTDIERASRNNADWLNVKVKERPDPILINRDLIEAPVEDFWKWRKKLNPDDKLLPFVHVWRGDCLTVHCVAPDTWVETTEGLQQIRDIAGEGVIATPAGPRRYHGLVSFPETPSLKITLKSGLELTVTPDHGVDAWHAERGYERVTASQLQVGDIMRTRLGVTVDASVPVSLPPLPPGDVRCRPVQVPVTVTEEFAQWLGMFVADGTLYRAGFRMVKRHRDVVEQFAALCSQLFGVDAPVKVSTNKHYTDPVYVCEVNSRLLVTWLRLLGGLDPRKKAVPVCVLRSPVNVHRAFMRGIAIDGSVHTRLGALDHIEITQQAPGLAQTLRVMLLRLGIISGQARGTRYRNVMIYGSFARKFIDEIGLITAFHRSKAEDARTPASKRYFVPVTKREIDEFRDLGRIDGFERYNARASLRISRSKASKIPELAPRLQWHHDEIITIEQVTSSSMCVEVPEGHQFLQNGVSGWNSSQGSQWDNVGFLWCSALTRMRRSEPGSARRFLYTAVTRAAQKLAIFSV